MQREAETLILSVDSATQLRSIAVTRGTHLLAQTRGLEQTSHAASLLAELDATLRQAGVSLSQIELFAVACGPGSFTGLRVGLATLKAFALTLSRPVVGVPTLHAIARATGVAKRVLALLPAGRGEVFAQLLSVSETGEVEELEAPVHVAPKILIEKAIARGGELKWAGGGAQLYAELIGKSAQSANILWSVESEGKMETVPDCNVWILSQAVESYAEQIAALALKSYRSAHTQSADELRALYVRLSDAELKEQCRV